MTVIYLIIGITLLMSVAAFQSNDLMDRWILRPYVMKNPRQWYRFITSGFIHANWPHLVINMLVFYFFAAAVYNNYYFYFTDKTWWYFLLLYLGAMVAADIPTVIQHKSHSWYASLGASGAVSAITFASVLLQPRSTIYMMGILPLPAIVWAVGYLAYSHYMSVRGGDNINHSAHFTGAVFGVFFTLLLRPAFAGDFIEKLTQGF